MLRRRYHATCYYEPSMVFLPVISSEMTVFSMVKVERIYYGHMHKAFEKVTISNRACQIQFFIYEICKKKRIPAGVLCNMYNILNKKYNMY